MDKYSFFASDIVHGVLNERSRAVGRSLNAEARRLIRLGFDLFLAQDYREVPPFLSTGALVHKLTIYSRGDPLFDDVRQYARQCEISPPQLFNAMIYLAVRVSTERDLEVIQRMVSAD